VEIGTRAQELFDPTMTINIMKKWDYRIDFFNSRVETCKQSKRERSGGECYDRVIGDLSNAYQNHTPAEADEESQDR
jgi:hypothetical protein